jgi:hypothetical protein
MRTHPRRPVRALALLALAAVLCAPAAAFALGEDQLNRGFASLGVGFLQPMSNDFDSTYDTSFDLLVEAGFILGVGPSGLALAPTAGFRYFKLNDNVGTDFNAWAWQLYAGLKAGFAGRGLFLYGEADIGLSTLQYSVCVFGFCDRADETDFMLRFGGGADFSILSFLAVGGEFGFPIVFSDQSGGTTEDTVGFELLAYAKFLFPEKAVR